MLETSNFVHYLAAWSISDAMHDYPLIGRGQGHVTYIIILHPWNISASATVIEFKFCTRVGHVKY